MSAPTFYLLYGEDSIERDAALEKLRASMGDGPNAELNISEFDGETASVAEIVNAASSYPFLADKRLVIVRDLIAHLTRKGAGETGKKALNELRERLPQLPPYARLVLVEREALAENHPIVQLARSDPSGYSKHFAPPKDPVAWIIKRARDHYQADIEPPAAQALASVTSDDLRRADNELIKLISYVDGGRPIREADVALLTPYKPEADIFKMIDALVAGRGSVALDILHRALANDPRDDGFGLFALITTQFRRLLLAREYLDNGGTPNGERMAAVVGTQAWLAEKIARQARAFSLGQLEHIYRALLDYDVRMKTGQIAPRLALDLIVASLASG